MIIHKYIWCLGIDPYHTVPFTISFVHIYLRSHMYDSVRTYMNDIYLWQIKHGNVCKNCVWTYISARLYSELHLNFAKEVKTILYVRYRYVIVYAYTIYIFFELCFAWVYECKVISFIWWYLRVYICRMYCTCLSN